MKLWIFFLCVLLLAGFCISEHCLANDNESVLQPRHEYWYHFKTEAFGEAVGTTNDRSRMMLDCRVHISHTHGCSYFLKMHDCLLSAVGGPPDSENAWIDKKEITDLSKYPIMFTLSDGEIKDVHVEENDPLFLVNIKRGALSAFVFKLSAADTEISETHVDIHGTCPWHSVPVNGKKGYVKASKNLLYCAYPSRPDWQFSPWSMFWNMSFIQYQINSTFDCEYKVNGNTLENVYCKERHAIGLESTHRTTTAVQTNIYYHMSYEKSSKTSSDATYSSPTRKTSISFEYDETPDPTESSEPQDFLPKAEEMLLELVEISQDEIRLFTIPKFTNFVAWIRTSHNLLPFVANVKTCSFSKNHLACGDDNIKELLMAYLSDALVQCNTVPCFEAVAKLTVDGSLSDMYLNFVLYSWNNMHFTKPAIIPHVKAICDAKDTKFCWLVLGKMIQNYRGTESLYQHPNELKNVTTYFHENIMTQCYDSLRSNVGDEEKYDRLLTNLKALTNIGTAYTVYYPNGALELLSCVRKATFPMPIRIAAVEALSVCKDVRNEEHPGYEGCLHLYRILSDMFFDSAIDVSLRLAIYDQIIEQPEIWYFMDLPNIFKRENNTQILSYVASDLNHRLNDILFEKKFPNFVNKINRAIEKNGIYLERYMNHEENKSKNKAFGSFFDFLFLPTEMHGFGAKLVESVMHPVYNMLPQSLKISSKVQLFNRVIELLRAHVNIEAIHEFQPLIYEIWKEMHGNPTSSDLLKRVVTIVQTYMSSPHSNSLPYENYPFSKVIMDNIQKLHDLLQQQKLPIKPSFNVYLDMLGSTINMFTSNDLKSLQSIQNNIILLLKKLQDGFTDNHTRVIRIIEAYHQVPTIMGLPLNWTTDATLAFSSRKHLQVSLYQREVDTQIQGHGYFQPSMALTFLNRMVLGFPTFTQIGVQANSSGYTSTQWAAHLIHPAEAHNTTRFIIDVPEKSQKILQLFRTNQLIKHNNYDDIPDWDVERTSASWCSSEKFSSAVGLQVCHQRSYPNVTHLIKPWALMAGWCKWTLEVNPYDKHLKSYNFKMEQGKHGPEIQTIITLNAPGSTYKREINSITSHKLDSTEFDVGIESKELKFNFALSHHRSDKKTTLAFLQLTDKLKYKMTLKNSADIVSRDQEETTDSDKASKSKKVKLLIKEILFELEAPYNFYKYTQKMHIQDKSMKMETFALFENYNPKWNWLSSIYPPTLWETRNTAWLKFRLNSRDSSPASLTWEIESPKSTIQLLSNSFSMQGRKHMSVNVTKVDSSHQLLSFANFTFNRWISANAKELCIWNFTIPKKSWSLREKQVLENGKVAYDGLFTIAQINPKTQSDQNYVGWWSEDIKDKFTLSLREFNMKTNVVAEKMDSSEIMKIVPTWPSSDNWSDKNNFIVANVTFSYPTSYRQESVTFDGYFIISNTSNLAKFQKDFALISSYHSMRLDSHSVYRSGNDYLKLTHKSFFTHSDSETQAFYNLDYNRVSHEDHGIPCYNIDFNHNISSHVLDFASNLSYHCDHSGRGVDSNNLLREVLTLNIDSSSDMWDMLNTKLRQRIEGTDGKNYETMNFSHPLMNINVVAEWDKETYSKHAVFTKTSDNAPAIIIDAKAKIPTTSEVVINMFGKNNHKIQLISEYIISSDFKQLTVKTFFPDKKHQVNKVQGIIIHPHKRIWTYSLYPDAKHFREATYQFRMDIMDMISKIASDPNHPLNQILKPALKMTLAQYWASLKGSILSYMFSTLNNAKYALAQLYPLYETPLHIISNIFSTSIEQVKHLYNLIENKSVTIWAIKYFQLPELSHEGFIHLSQGFEMFNDILYPPNRVHKFVYPTGELLKWKSFIQNPEFVTKKFNNQYGSTAIKPYHGFAKSKVGMIFGARHVFTFDGFIYEFPEYPSNDCTYLLAHDVHQSRFSILSTKDSIHVLYPEMAITVTAVGQLFINGSQVPSLPIESANRNVMIQKEGEIFKIISPLTVILCDTRNEFCTFELTAWNGGATLGLLGNADGEVYNEYMVPDGSVKNNIAEFAQYYEMTGKPECQNLKLESPPLQRYKNQCSEDLEDICDSLFNKQDGFINSCSIDVEERGTTCPTKMAVSALCSLENEIMSADCNVTSKESEHENKVEVIFVVDEHESTAGDSRGIFLKGMESLINAIDQQYETKGYTVKSYSLIGFGGAGVHFHPSVHTVKNDIWLPAKAATNDLLKTLRFEGTTKGNAIGALRYAIEVLGHDTVDSKLVIFITNEDRQVASKELMHSIQKFLEKNFITLYTLASYPTIEKGKKVFGVRADGLMFPSPSKSGEAYLDYPRGDLAKLTSATRGSLFLKNFLDSNGPPTFFEEVAREMSAEHRIVWTCIAKCTTLRRWWHQCTNDC